MNSSASLGNEGIAVWIRVLLIVCAILMAMGAVIALVHPGLLVVPGAEINVAVKTYAGYLTARNMTLAIMLVFFLWIGARRALATLTAIVGFIQILDAVVDCLEKRWAIAPGVLVLGLLLLLAAQRVAGQPFWRRAAWV